MLFLATAIIFVQFIVQYTQDDSWFVSVSCETFQKIQKSRQPTMTGYTFFHFFFDFSLEILFQ